MQLICDMVLTDLKSGTSKNSNKQYFVFEGVIVRCEDFPALSGVSVRKFISEETFMELSGLTVDRFDCSIGISRTSANPRDCDVAFNLFINGLPKEDEDNVSQSPAAPKDKNKKKEE